MQDEKSSMECPVCQKVQHNVTINQLNQHIDACLSMSFLEEERGGGSGNNHNNMPPAPTSAFRKVSTKAAKTTSPLRKGPSYAESDSSESDDSEEMSYEDDDESLGCCAGCGTQTSLFGEGFCMSCRPVARSSQGPLRCSGSNPFKVMCPYPSCPVQQMEAHRFPAHAVETHSTCVQTFGCPVCHLQSGIVYSVNQNTNLLQHLRSIHPEMLVPQPYSSGWSTDSFDYNVPVRKKRTSSTKSRPVPAPIYTSTTSCNECNVADGHLTTCSAFKKGEESVTASVLRARLPWQTAQPLGAHRNTQEDEEELDSFLDLFGNGEPPVVVASSTTTTTTIPASIINTSALRFIEETLKEGHNLAEKECEICYENFAVNDVVARLECFCIYHTTCVSVWFKKVGGNKCPLHSQDAT